MQMRYVAYGLALRSSFRLPGMVPTDAEGLPHLDLELVTPEELAKRWSGAKGAPAWRGRLGDESDLTVEHGIAGDLLFTNGERGCFRLDPSGTALACAPRLAGLHWQRTLLTKVLSSVSIARGYEALHASAVESPSGAIAIAAPAGAGKTTLALELMARGGSLLSDDVLILAPGPDGVLAHPGTPHMNVAASSPDGLSPNDVGSVLGVLSGECWVAARAIACEPCPVHAICLLERGGNQSLDVQLLSPHPMPLARYVLGPRHDADRERRKFELFADLTSSASLLRVTCGATHPPADLADAIERILADRPAALALGVPR